jgi:hypothetical protein
MVDSQRSTVGELDGLAGLVFMAVHNESVYFCGLLEGCLHLAVSYI